MACEGIRLGPEKGAKKAVIGKSDERAPQR
jgi:hypothetical protein